jgi:hypothetical protein
MEYIEKDITYLDIPVIQKIISTKFKDHAKSKYVVDFIIMLAFIVSYIITLISFSKVIEKSNEDWRKTRIALGIFGAVLTGYFAILESVQIWFHGFS